MHAFPAHFVPAYACGALLGLPSLKWTSGSVEGPAFLSAGIHAAAAVASGTADVVLALRPMLRLGATGPTPGARAAGGRQFLEPFGAGRPAQWAGMIKQRMMAEFGWGEEAFGRQMVAQREFAALNPDALLRDPLTLEDYLDARYVSKPLRLLDCDYPVTGACAAIITTAERARDLAGTGVTVDSVAFGTGSRPDWTFTDDFVFGGTIGCARALWANSTVTPEDVDVAELYDGFTHITISWVEALGLCGIGEFGDWVDGGKRIGPGGPLPLNTNGGQLAAGRLHGLAFLTEAVQQLRGDCGERQVPGARVAVVANAHGPQCGAMVLTRS
jgi:acetyl-CoA acetyltransferase